MITEINYTNTIPEIKRAYSLFRRKYVLPRMLPVTLLFLVTLVIGIDFIVKNPSGFTGYILAALSGGMLVSLFMRPFTMQQKLITTIEALGNDEKYTARFYDDRIEVDTEIIPLETETEIVAVSGSSISKVENPEVLESIKQGETPLTSSAQAETSVIGLSTETLFSVEAADMFCLFVNKALIYIFPKRCLTEEQISDLSSYFKEKAI